MIFNKKTLLVGPRSSAILLNYAWRVYFEKYFNIKQLHSIDELNNFNPKECIFWAGSTEYALTWIEPILNQGFRVILDYLWDHFGYSTKTDSVLVLKSNNFIFCNESLNYSQWNYNQLQFTHQPKDSLFLCLMNLSRPHRDLIYEKIKKYTQSMISYLDKGVTIPGDCSNNPNWQRYINTDWYNKTNFSLVVETSVNDPRFYSEKILKPLAFKHPFIVWGSYNILERIKSLGFESYNNVIDESYNLCINNTQRLELLLDEVSRLSNQFEKNRTLFNDKLTNEKLEHNFNLFYNKNLVNRIIEQEILTPVLEFSNA